MISGFELVLDYTEPEPRVMTHPGKKPEVRPHVLWIDDEYGAIGIDHDERCYSEYGEIECDVRHVEDWYGFEGFENLPVGGYWIKAEWTVSYFGSYNDDYEIDGEIVLMYPEELPE